jgi:poly-gamma-glutamate synthesis protein (capsule biosynthesis protein)
VKQVVQSDDLTVLNLECAVSKRGTAENKTFTFRANPAVLPGLRHAGIEAVTLGNNHAMDYSYDGLIKTREYIHDAGFKFAGTGRTLGEASEPCYLDTLSGRFAMMAACSTFHPEAMAGEQTRRMVGRPGLNGIRYQTVCQVTDEDLEKVRELAAKTGINAKDDITRKEGYLPPIPEGKAMLGTLQFEAAEKAATRTYLNGQDMKRIEQSIHEARFMADYVVISMHSHEISGTSKEQPAEFFVDFAHRCIDEGADAVVGHGPHLLRPIEIYKGCPIFYSLGDFIIQLETIARAPAGMFENQKMTGNEGLDAMFNDRSGGGKHGLYYERKMFEAVVPYWEVENGKLTKLVLMPIEEHFGSKRSVGGWPRPKSDCGILERLAEMSSPYGTKIHIVDSLGIVELGE